MMTEQEMINRVHDFPLENGEITGVRWMDTTKNAEIDFMKKRLYEVGGYCRVELMLHPTVFSNIKVVALLPGENSWNRCFLGTGNGGFAGNIAEGSILNGVSRGYVSVNTDMGSSLEPYDLVGNEAIIEDFGHRATHLMTVVGKELTKWVYGENPKYSYFFGGSTGGQQAMMEAQRYPEDYDGIVCLSPAFDRIRLHASFIWNWQKIHEQENAGFTLEQAAKWRACVERVYKEFCGSNPEDQFLAYPGRITENPMDNPLLQEDIKRLLTPGQAKALRGIYDGPKDPVTGERIIAHFLPGTENEMLSLENLSHKHEFAHDSFFPFYWAWGTDIDFMKFDFHDNLQRAIEEIGPVMDANNPDLSAFKAHGGKLIVVGGSSDAIIPYTGFLDYYHKVINMQGGLENTKTFCRFFLMPGFSHTIGGNGVMDVGGMGADCIPRDAQHDVITAISSWVEDGVAPERLLGSHFSMGLDGVKFVYDRPAYAYPYVTEFLGGDPENCDNYRPVYNESAYR